MWPLFAGGEACTRDFAPFVFTRLNADATQLGEEGCTGRWTKRRYINSLYSASAQGMRLLFTQDIFAEFRAGFWVRDVERETK